MTSIHRLRTKQAFWMSYDEIIGNRHRQEVTATPLKSTQPNLESGFELLPRFQNPKSGIDSSLGKIECVRRAGIRLHRNHRAIRRRVDDQVGKLALGANLNRDPV